jgi:hypothetical protein
MRRYRHVCTCICMHTFTLSLEVEGEREEGKEGHVESDRRLLFGHGFFCSCVWYEIEQRWLMMVSPARESRALYIRGRKIRVEIKVHQFRPATAQKLRSQLYSFFPLSINAKRPQFRRMYLCHYVYSFCSFRSLVCIPRYLFSCNVLAQSQKKQF